VDKFYIFFRVLSKGNCIIQRYFTLISRMAFIAIWFRSLYSRLSFNQDNLSYIIHMDQDIIYIRCIYYRSKKCITYRAHKSILAYTVANCHMGYNSYMTTGLTCSICGNNNASQVTTSATYCVACYGRYYKKPWHTAWFRLYCIYDTRWVIQEARSPMAWLL
jgi:hypothetical protein